jgi:multiple sugar transport system ATP-binding protein
MGSPAMNFVNVKIEAKGDVYEVTEAGVGFSLSLKKDQFSYLESYAGKEIVMGIRPENIVDRIYAQVKEADDIIHATVEAEEPMGSENYIHANTGSNKIIMRTAGVNRVKMGDELELLFNLEKIHFFEKETGARIDTK